MKSIHHPGFRLPTPAYFVTFIHDTKARNKLKNLLILTCRLLAVFFLVMAFAQPFIPQDNATVTKGQKAVSIWVDNSFSMDAVGTSGSLLDEVKKDAREIVAAYGATDRFQLLTNDFEGRHQRLVSKEEFLELLEEVKPSPAVRNVSEVVRRQQDLLNNTPDIESGNRQAFLLSDFQQTISDYGRIETDTAIQFREIIASAQNRNNIFIDSVRVPKQTLRMCAWCFTSTAMRRLLQVSA